MYDCRKSAFAGFSTYRKGELVKIQQKKQKESLPGSMAAALFFFLLLTQPVGSTLFLLPLLAGLFLTDGLVYHPLLVLYYKQAEKGISIPSIWHHSIFRK